MLVVTAATASVVFAKKLFKLLDHNITFWFNGKIIRFGYISDTHQIANVTMCDRKEETKICKIVFCQTSKIKVVLLTVIITIKPTNFLPKFHRMIGYMKLELKFFINERNVLAECFKNKTNSAIRIGGFIAAISVEFPRAVYFFYSRLQFIVQQ